jgi:formylglycine-generating enzyme required for sulfatase activity
LDEHTTQFHCMQGQRILRTCAITVLVAGCGVAPMANGQVGSDSAHAADVSTQPASAAAAKKLPPWEPSAKQLAVLQSLPSSVEEQRAELIRLAKIPLPSYEERRRFLDLLGDGFPKSPEEHPLRKNAPFLLEYYRSLPKPTQQELDELLASLKQRMLFVKGGSFTMGDFGPMKLKDKLTITGDSNNDPHDVSLDSFSIMKGRVTFGELDLYLRATGKPLISEADQGYAMVDAYRRRPGYVAWPVKWPDADGYCGWLARLTGQPFQLPTEAQWEYAAREGGKFIAYPMHGYPAIRWQNEYMPHFESVDESLNIVTARVGQPVTFIRPRPPSLYGENRIGMQGVVDPSNGEWVADWYGETYYQESAKRNPRGPVGGTQRVMRPGAYGFTRSVLSRRGHAPEDGFMFRCAIDSAKPWQ